MSETRRSNPDHQSQPLPRRCPSKNLIDQIYEIQLQKQQACNQNQQLRTINRQLQYRLERYERQLEGMRNIEEQLKFRKEDEKSMHEHCRNYEMIIEKLRRKVCELEMQNMQRDQPTNSDQLIHNDQLMQNGSNVSKKQQSETDFRNSIRQMSHQRPSLQINKSMYNTEKKPPNQTAASANRPSRNLSGKQNHLLTPKSKIKINLDGCITSELNKIQEIKSRRKVFM